MKKSLTKIGGHARQGDVLLRRIKPNISPPPSVGNVPLARGEVTGHHHSFVGPATCFGTIDNPVMVRVPEALPLEHQEHAPITFPKGWYEKLTQVEDTSMEVRRVAD